MIILDATTKKLEIILGGAVTTNQLPWTAHYVDVSQTDFSASAVTEADGVTNGGTAVQMVAAPAASVSRQIKFLSVYQADTANAAVTIRYNNNGTTRVIFSGTLSVGDNLIFED